jgi:tetratricopeptide (TPR) repeat protein
MLSQLGRTAAAFIQFDSARTHLEHMRENLPDQAWIHALLGVAYAGVNRTDEAIRSAERAVQLQPVSTDALDGPERLITLAQVHAMVGNDEKAIEHYSRALAVPSYVSATSLRLDPFVGSLGKNPAFQRLVAARR